MENIKLGTRGSALAMKQTEMVVELLRGHKVEVIKIKTSGDKDQISPISEIGGKELFTKEIDLEMLDGNIDIAVHSLKDVSGTLNEGITIAAVLERIDPRDSLIGAENISSLPAGAKIGTSSPRRKAQLLNLRDDLEILDIRGNLGTRIEKFENGDYDAIILASAGLKRLGLNEYTNPVSALEMTPAIGQAAIAITCRTDDLKTQEILTEINHQKSYLRVMCEREVLKVYGADCHTPIAAHAEIHGSEIVLNGFVANDECTNSDTAQLRGNIKKATQLGAEMGELLLEKRKKL